MNEKLLNYFNDDELAAIVWFDKYAAKGEETPDDMHMRMAKAFADKLYERIVETLKNPNPDQDKLLSLFGRTLMDEYKRAFRNNNLEDYLYENIYNLFKEFKYIIPQGSIMSSLGTNTFASLSNCWVVESPYDSYAGIFKTDSELGFYYKRRGGAGTDISNLRPKGTDTNNTAKSTTGAVSFMHRFSNTTREVAQEGRRGALMLSMHINHPDSMDFIKVKRDGTSVTGANISLRLSNEFMEAVKEDKDYILRYPIDLELGEDDFEDLIYDKLYPHMSGYVKKIRAKEYWNEIIYSAKNHAEPGLMYWDNVLDYDPAAVYDQFIPTSSNPCVSGDTLVLTPEGYVRADSINEGDILSTVIGEEPVKTKEVNHNMQLYKVGFSDGGSVRVTASHQFHARVKNSKFIKEVELRNLSIGDSVRIGGAVGIGSIPKNEEYTLGLKQGIILGDGCFTKNTETIKISSNLEDVEYNKNVKALFGEDNFRKDDISKDSKSMSMVTKSEYSKELAKELKFESGYSYEKNIDLTQVKGHSQMLGILDGLLATDGNVNLSSNHPQIRFFTTSPKLAENIRLMLLAIGSYGIITESNDAGGIIDGRDIKRKHIKYSINISGESFRNYALKSYLKDLHPEKGKDMVKALSTAILSGNNWSTKITSIEKDGIETVYDFFCEESDTWLTNGYVSRGCGEQFLNPFDSCRLMALNLFSFVDNPFTDNAKINFDKLFEVSYLHTILGDVLVDLELEYISRIINKINADPEPMSVKRGELDLWIKSYNATKAGRRIGLGLTALGDTLAALGIQYGSEDSLEVIEDLMSVKMEGEFTASVDMSIDYGTFKGWNASKEFDYEVDPNTQYIHVNNGKNKFYQTMLEEFPELVEKMIRYGRRNVSLSTIAPTGSTSLLSQTTSGCEPLFMPFYMRRKKVNPSEEGVDVDFVDEVGDSWQEFPVLHPKFKDWLLSENSPIHKDDRESKVKYINQFKEEDLQKLFEQSPWYMSTANDIDWIQRNKVQAVLQKYTTNAISSTINLPSTVTEEEVSDIYLSGWDLGLKGQTVYVNGSRSGVLVDKNTNTKRDEFEYVDAVKRPKDLECECHVSTIKGVKYNIFVGLLNNKPYEVFISDYFTGKSKFILSKVRKGRYDLLLNGETYSENITAEMSDEQEAITRLVSTSLRHGTNIKYIVEQLQKTTQGDMFGFTRGLARVLKKYIPDGEISTVTCQDCESKSVIFEEGCFKCMDCGSSACG